MRIFASILAFILINLIISPLSAALGVSIEAQVIGTAVLGTGMSFIPASGIAYMALIPELWTGEILKHFRHEGEFLSRIPKRNQYVKYNAVHLVDLGADPNVLIDNTTYPIASAQRVDQDVVINLHKFDTENTIITDDELNNLPYDKPGSVIESHRLALEDSTLSMSAHSLAPQAGSAQTPVVMTTGSSNGETQARKRMRMADIIKAQRFLDDLKVPSKGRELVLCPAHVEDLLLTDQTFKDQWFKTNSGELMDLHSFKISKFSGGAKFSNTTGEKKAYGAAADVTVDLDVSMFYYAPRAVQARGTVSMYHAKAENDPKNRQSEIGFRLHHLCLPKKTTGFGAIVSDVT